MLHVIFAMFCAQWGYIYNVLSYGVDRRKLFVIVFMVTVNLF